MTNWGIIKCGDTFQYVLEWEGAELEQLSSEVRDYGGKLLSEVSIETFGDKFKLTVLDTSDWPVGTVYTDIRRIDNSNIETCDTMTITVNRRITSD